MQESRGMNMISNSVILVFYVIFGDVRKGELPIQKSFPQGDFLLEFFGFSSR